MTIQYYGMLNRPHSWAYVSAAILKEFKKMGIDIEIRSTNGINDIDPALTSDVKALNSKISTDISFSYTLPRNLRKIDAKHRIQIYNYETTRMPPGFAKAMNESAHLILPSSTFARDIFIQNGVIPQKMEVVPHGYDPDEFNPSITPISINEETDKKFKFTMVAAPHWRKGHDIMLKAYLEEFKDNDDVVLLIKTSMNSHESSSHFHINLQKLIEEMKKTHNYKWPDIQVIDYKIPTLASLYTYSDCLVLPTRTECFSLTPLEAMACMTPIITTEYGGHLDYLNHENSYLIDYVMRRAPREGQYHNNDPEALLAEPSVADLKKLMRNVKDNYKEALEKTKLGNTQIKETHTWEAVAKQILKLIEDRGWNV